MKSNNLTCPIPFNENERITMAHGGGGKAMQKLIDSCIIETFDNQYLNEKNDSSVLPITNNKIAFTTDSFVIKPIFFPGGDIGSLAVIGTVNDLAVSGAEPRYISAAFIIEEGFLINDLFRIVKSMYETARKVGVEIVTGDTKVVEKGHGDGIYINTTGIGEFNITDLPSSKKIQEGDKIIINGDIARHGMAVMAAREGLEFESTIESDCEELSTIIKKLLDEGIRIHCMRDLTRGGLVSGLVEVIQQTNLSCIIEENKIFVKDEVNAACEILGLDPLYVANEGKFVMIIHQDDENKALKILHESNSGKHAVTIGQVAKTNPGNVLIKNFLGVTRYLEMINGEQLPRIC